MQNIDLGSWLKLGKSGHSYVVDTLGLEVITGRYPVGSIMPGDAFLLDRFRVSRTVLREAMKTLSAKGLFVARARIGTRVNDRVHWNMFDRDILKWHFIGACDANFIRQVNEIRRAVEPSAAMLAAANASEAQIGELFRIANTIVTAAQSGDGVFNIDFEFHKCVLEASGNHFMRNIADIVEVSMAFSVRVENEMYSESTVLKIADTQKMVAEAIQRRDADVALHAMRKLLSAAVTEQFLSAAG